MAATLLADNLRDAVDNGMLVGAIFVDLSKAFDTLSHEILLSKLRSFGIKGLSYSWFHDYLFNRKQCCVVDGVTSELKSITCGVPQGSILGPVMFFLYFNDLQNCLKHSRVIKFADDTVLYISNKNFYVIEEKLNEDLLYMKNYLELNELVINLKKGKSESMLFGSQNP